MDTEIAQQRLSAIGSEATALKMRGRSEKSRDQSARSHFNATSIGVEFPIRYSRLRTGRTHYVSYKVELRRNALKESNDTSTSHVNTDELCQYDEDDDAEDAEDRRGATGAAAAQRRAALCITRLLRGYVRARAGTGGAWGRDSESDLGRPQ
ncbi:hypothetical protein EVAR_43721_1 [Eumeta japonica]|uniref:Uncharacterized protein n=1 Tax=Eumeta variegata TaxID=151549 RepID=A0A4C1Y3C4_EUMVA|nr:hypothetical protein EVAR_43721_1 [Eumeta japonica]